MDKSYQEFAKRTEEFTDKISLKDAIRTARKGKASFRDSFVFGKMAWSEALTYFAILQSMVIFMALVPTAIENVNGFLTVLGIPFQFPVDISSVIAIVVIVFIFSFGLVGYRYLGLPRRSQEVSSKMSSGQYLTWYELQVVKEELQVLTGMLQTLKKEIEELRKKNEN